MGIETDCECRENELITNVAGILAGVAAMMLIAD